VNNTDLQALRQRVEGEIENYRYHAPTNSIGLPWTSQRIEAELAAMRASILEPYWAHVELHDTLEQISRGKLA
jgi:hypothetical protein